MSKYSNVLKVPAISDHAINLMKRIYNKLDLANNPSRNLINSVFEYKRSANIIIETTSNSANYPEKNLSEITKEDKHAIMTLNVVDYLPNNILDFSQVFCPHCKER
jgi:hypothetical protein